MNNVAVEDMEEERKTFRRIVNAFLFYRTKSLSRLDDTIRYLTSLPDRHRRLLINYSDNFAAIKNCISCNYDVIVEMIEDSEPSNLFNLFENDLKPRLESQRSPINKSDIQPTFSDLEKVQSTLKQFVRDWSPQGIEERNTCYKPIVDEILKEFPLESITPSNIKILVPGAGLGRLVFEIAKLGYTSQGNEFSIFMLIASDFVLNRCKGVNTYTLYPWVHQCDNNLETDHQMQSITFPDVNPCQEFPRNGNISITAGDFTEAYKLKDQWNCVATCFFIDCAPNIVAFIETIYNILEPGGIWINLGPLLYHYSNVNDQGSIEPSYQVIKDVIKGIGFQMEKEILNVPTKYAQNPLSMLQYEYKSVYFVCRKPKLNQFLETPASPENGIYENNIHHPVDEKVDTQNFNSDIDDHNSDTN